MNKTYFDRSRKKNVIKGQRCRLEAGCQIPKSCQPPNPMKPLHSCRHTAIHQGCRGPPLLCPKARATRVTGSLLCCLLLIGNLISVYLTAEPRAQACTLVSRETGKNKFPAPPGYTNSECLAHVKPVMMLTIMTVITTVTISL